MRLADRQSVRGCTTLFQSARLDVGSPGASDWAYRRLSGGNPLEAFSGLLFLAALALLIGGAVAAVANRVRPALSRDKIVRPDLPPTASASPAP